MPELNMQDLIECFNVAIACRLDVIVMIKVPNLIDPEIVANYNSSLAEKLKYYKNTYDENLFHRYNKNNKIIGFVAMKMPIW